jgi:SAM-dependent methyltransferase
VAEWVSTQIDRHQLPIRTVREIGGGTGAFAREFLNRRPAVESFELNDLSREKVRFARHLLLGEGDLPGFPLLGADFSITWRPFATAAIRELALPTGALRITQGEGANWDGTADLVVSLNVADRVKDPRLFTRDLADQVTPAGAFVLATPLDWIAGVTPEGNRVKTLDQLLPPGWHILARAEFLFTFRSHPRRVVQFLTEAVMARR